MINSEFKEIEIEIPAVNKPYSEAEGQNIMFTSWGERSLF